MIVSVTISDNREDQIADAIESVVDHVDQVLLVDTGITDETVERVEEIAGDKLIVVEHDWVDFSTARNASLAAARELGAEWIVIVDSDERIDFGDLDLRAMLAKMRTDTLEIESDDGRYPKPKILRASATYLHFEGPTHETIVGAHPETLNGATFHELLKTEAQLRRKFTRDLLILTDHVAKHPHDARWWHYLGVSYEGLGDYARAAAAFGECVTRTKFGEEAAWAAFKQAEQFHTLKRYEEAIAASARGMAASSTSAECAWVAAVASWRLGRPEQSVAWARICEAVGRYKGCGPYRSSFRHPPAMYELPYDVLREALPDEEGRRWADAEYYKAQAVRLGITEEDDLEELSISPDVLESKRAGAREMLRPPLLKSICSTARSLEIRFDPPGGMHPTNPSVCNHNGELWCVVRAVNYQIGKHGYDIDDAQGVVRTENYLGKLAPDGSLVDATLMRDLDPSPREKSRIVGYEDVRLVSVSGVLSGSATVCDRDPNERCLIVKLHLSEFGDVIEAVAQRTDQLHEKNWMPISVEGKFAWIYSIDPTAILPGPLRPCPFALDHLRGGAAIKFKNGYLCVVHEVIEKSDRSRVYLHRFVELDKIFNVTAVSKTWVFDHHGVEFCAGLALDGEDLVLSYGIEDREARIIRIDSSDLEKMDWFEADEKESPVVSAPRGDRPLRLTVVNSQHKRCGVREYGDQLDRSFALDRGVELLSRTFDNVSVSHLTRSDIVLVHFEDGLFPQGFHSKLSAAKKSGARIVFCCHRYEAGAEGAIFSLVDRFVLHRHYDRAPLNSVVIPLGCPVYSPSESREEIRVRLGLPVDKIVVTSIGFFASWKRWGDVVEAVARELGDAAFLQIHTAIPFLRDAAPENELARVRTAIGNGRHTTEFLKERDLLDRVYASDLGFVFHPIHTGSVSAATKQFVSARCPLVVTSSSHASDINGGVLRVDSFDPKVMAKEIRRVVEDDGLRGRLSDEMRAEYDRLNMDRIAEQYLKLFKELVP